MAPGVLRALLTTLAAAFLLAPTGAAQADPPPELERQIVDLNGELTAGEDELRAALARLDTEDGIELYVVSVDSTDGMDLVQWADEAAISSGLGDDQPVLVLASEDDDYGLSVGQGFALDDAALGQVTDAVEGPFNAGDHAAAGVAAAEVMREQADRSGSSGVWLFGGLALVGGGLAAAVAVSQARRKRRWEQGAPGWTPPRQGEPEVPVAELSTRSNRMLVATDEDVRGADRELAFAQAEFGDDTVAVFAQSLGEAKNAVLQAFSIRQKLDDSEPETEQQQRQMLEQIESLCRRVREILTSQGTEFSELRDLAGRIPQLLPALLERTGAAEAAVPGAQQEVAELSARFSPQAVEAVQQAPQEAAVRLVDARQALEDVGPPALHADSTAAAGQPPKGPVSSEQTGAAAGAAAVALRRAEEALAQAEQLLSSVDRVGNELQQAGQSLPRAVRALTEDVQGARTAAPQALSQELQQALESADRALGYAEASGRVDPVGALSQVGHAGAALDAALAGAREQDERLVRARATLPQAFSGAQAQVDAAEDLIATHRSVVAGTARTRAAEARRLLEQSRVTADIDPLAALEGLNRADDLARQAQAQARTDISSVRFDQIISPTGYGGSVATGGILDAIFGGGWSSGSGGGWSSGGGGGGGWSSGGGSWGGGGQSGGRSASRRSSSSRGSSSRRSSSRSGGGRRSSRRR